MKSLLLFTILAVTACSTPKETKKVPEAADTVKPGAPTRLESQISASSAKLNLRFDGPGENVSVSVSGIEGLVVTSPSEVVSGIAVKANDVTAMEVAFTGQGHLVITVRGTFNGFTQSRVHTVKVGEGLAPDTGKIQVTSDGDAVKLLP